MHVFRAIAASCLSIFLMSSSAFAQDDKPAPGPGDKSTPSVPAGSVFVAPVEAQNDKLKDFAVSVEDTITKEIRSHKEYALASSAGEIDDIAKCKTFQAQVGGEETEECLAAIEKATDAQYLVSTTVGKIGREYAVTITLLDAKESKVLGKEAASAFTTSDALANVKTQVAKLFGYGDADAVIFKLPDSKGVTKFGVFGIESSGVSESDVSNLEQFLCVELSKLQGAEVITPKDIEDVLGTKTFAADCDDACMAKVAGSANVDYMVTGQVGSFTTETEATAEGEEQGRQELREFIISLKLIDPKKVKVVSLRTVAFRSPKEELKRAVRTAARDLLGVETELGGTVAVSGPVSGADVFIKDKKVGALPIKLSTEYPPVRTGVRLVKDGYYAWESDVFIQPGEENLVWADMQERPDPIYKKWWFWTIIGVAVVGGTTAGVLLASDDPETGSGTVVIR